jgi:hypothetical protein
VKTSFFSYSTGCHQHDTEKAIWKKKIEIYVQHEMALEENNRALYALVMGQCTETMRAKLESQATFEAVDNTLSGLGLQVMIRVLVYQLHSQKYLPHSIHEAMRQIVNFQQRKGMTAAAYLEQFQNLVEVATHTGASAGLHAGIVVEISEEMQVDLTQATRAKIMATQAAAKERFQATSFLLNSDRSRYGWFIEDIENAYIQGQNRYPATITASYDLFVNR